MGQFYSCYLTDERALERIKTLHCCRDPSLYRLIAELGAHTSANVAAFCTILRGGIDHATMSGAGPVSAAFETIVAHLATFVDEIRAGGGDIERVADGLSLPLSLLDHPRIPVVPEHCDILAWSVEEASNTAQSVASFLLRLRGEPAADSALEEHFVALDKLFTRAATEGKCLLIIPPQDSHSQDFGSLALGSPHDWDILGRLCWRVIPGEVDPSEVLDALGRRASSCETIPRRMALHSDLHPQSHRSEDAPLIVFHHKGHTWVSHSSPQSIGLCGYSASTNALLRKVPRVGYFEIDDSFVFASEWTEDEQDVCTTADGSCTITLRGNTYVFNDDREDVHTFLTAMCQYSDADGWEEVFLKLGATAKQYELVPR